MRLKTSDELHRRCGQHLYSPVHETLNDGHLCLLERLVGVTAGGVGHVDGVAERDVVCGKRMSVVQTKYNLYAPVREISFTSTSVTSHFPNILTLPATGTEALEICAGTLDMLGSTCGRQRW